MLQSRSGLFYHAYGGLDSLNQLLPCEVREAHKLQRSVKRKKAIFMISMWGTVFHPRLVHLVIALPPPHSLKELNYVVKRLFAWSRRFTGEHIEYRASWVWEDGHPHVHLLCTMPFIEQGLLVNQVQGYLGDNAHVYIKLLKTEKERKIAVSYLMQYVVYQDGDVRYTSSRGWVPLNAQEHWEAIKAGLRDGLGENILSSKEWREKAIEAMNAWLMEERGKRCQRGIDSFCHA